MTTYTAINLIARPSAGPVGPDLFEVVQKEMPVVAKGQFLVKQSHMSLDPAMFGWMSPDTESYIPPVALGDVMRSSGIGEIIESNHDDFQVGDRVMGMMGWQEYYLSDGSGLNKVTAPLPSEAVLSVFALPGLTATQGLYSIGKTKKGETIVVSGSHSAMSIAQLAGNVSVMTAAEIANSQAAFVSELLVQFAGVDISTNGGVGQARLANQFSGFASLGRYWVRRPIK